MVAAALFSPLLIYLISWLSPFVSRIKEDHVIQHGLVVDGASLSLALREHEKLFMEVCKNCSAVLCCRMAPLQKAKVISPPLYTHTNQTNVLPSRLKQPFGWCHHLFSVVIFLPVWLIKYVHVLSYYFCLLMVMHFHIWIHMLISLCLSRWCVF